MSRHDGLAALRQRRPLRLLGVWAHPDDEAYLSAGLMHRVAAAGGLVVCLTATRGEWGVPDGDVRPRAAVERLREAELRASLAEVGAHSLRLLHHPDGGCSRVPRARAVAQVRHTLQAVRPDIVVTFGPDGITGHPDHVAVHGWVTEAWRHVGRPEATLLYATMSQEFLADFADLHRRTGVFGDHEPVGHPREALDLVVDLDPAELDRKRRALAAHASQTAGLAEAMGEATYRRWWAEESFRLPTPSELGEAVATAATHG